MITPIFLSLYRLLDYRDLISQQPSWKKNILFYKNKMPYKIAPNQPKTTNLCCSGIFAFISFPMEFHKPEVGGAQKKWETTWTDMFLETSREHVGGSRGLATFLGSPRAS